MSQIDRGATPKAATPEAAADSSAAFAEFLAEIRFRDLPEEVVQVSRRGIVDTIGVILAGSGTESVAAILRMLTRWGGTPEAGVFGSSLRLPAVAAGFANAAMAHQYDFDDTHDQAVVHPTANSLTAALAAAEARGGCSGEDLLRAVVLGNEIACRLGLAIRGDLYDYPWTRPPVIGTFGAVAAASAILGLDPARTRSAFGLTLHQACNTLECLYAPGSEVRGLRDGFSVRNALTAAFMAAEGVQADHSAIDGRFGLFNAFFRGEYDRPGLTEGLGSRYAAADVSIKPWPSARETHATIHAVLDLRRRHAIDPAAVAQVELTVGRANLEFCEPGAQRRRPRSKMDALSSLPFAVAVALRHGAVPLQAYRADALGDAATLALADRVSWALDPAIREGTIEGGRVRIVLADGRAFETAARHAFGHPGQPLPPDILARKFRDCAAMAATPPDEGRIDGLLQVLANLEGRPVGDLVDALQWGEASRG